jgi:hypothetical protein
MRRFMEANTFHTLVPDAKLIADGPATGASKIKAMRAQDGSRVAVYSSRGEPLRSPIQRLPRRGPLPLVRQKPDSPDPGAGAIAGAGRHGGHRHGDAVVLAARDERGLARDLALRNRAPVRVPNETASRIP